MTNTLSLSAPYDDLSLGMGFDPIVCSANHSCDPNAVVMFNQPQVVVRALSRISAGEEVFIKYIDTTNPRSVRRAELNESYYFECNCAKCKLGWPKSSSAVISRDACLCRIDSQTRMRHARTRGCLSHSRITCLRKRFPMIRGTVGNSSLSAFVGGGKTVSASGSSSEY